MSTFGKIVKEGRDFVCALYKAQPGALIPNPISDGLHYVWDSICDYPDSPGLPPPPQVPFDGGQCNRIGYKVAVTYNGTYQGNTLVDTYVVEVHGEVAGVTFEIKPNRNLNTLITCHGYWSLPYSLSLITVGREGYNTAGVTNIRIVGIVISRIDGQPDNCGNPPPSFPPAPPPPPGGYTSPPVEITLNDNSTTNITFNFTPPKMPLPPAAFLPPVIVNFFRPEIKPEFNIPINFNFDGTINIGGGDGGSGFNSDDRDTINNINNNVNTVGGVTNNIQNDINNYINFNNNKNPDPNDFEPPKTDIPPGEHEQEYLAAVEISLTQVPKNAKTQSGNTADDVVYAGWFEWRRAGQNLPREPIHFKENVFLAPAGIDGYAYTLYTGYEGKATEIINKPREG